MVSDVVLFVDFLVDLSSESRKNHLLPNSAIEQPNDDKVLDYGPGELRNDVCRIGEDSPGLWPKPGCRSIFYYEVD